MCAYNIRQARKHRKKREAVAEAEEETAAASAETTSAVIVEHDIVLLTAVDIPSNGQQDDFEPAASHSGTGHGDPISHPPPT